MYCETRIFWSPSIRKLAAVFAIYT